MTERYFPAFKSAIARLQTANGAIVGAGFLVAPGYVITCAHVVASAIGVASSTPEIPTNLVYLDFPLMAPGKRLTATVVCWRPQKTIAEAQLDPIEDIAGLALQGELPSGLQVPPLVTASALWDHPFRVFGFPKGCDEGIWADGVLREQQANGWLQIEALRVPGYKIEQGFSGAPVWDETLGGIVGMTVAATTAKETKIGFVIPSPQLALAWEQVQILSAPSPRFAPRLTRTQQLIRQSRAEELQSREEEFMAVHNQLNASLSDEERVKLRRRRQQLEQEMSRIAQELEDLGGGSD